jgi:hypothetical protein
VGRWTGWSYDVEWDLWDSLSVFTGLSFPSDFGGKARLDGLIPGGKHDLGAIIGEEHKGRPYHHAVSVCVNKDNIA